MGWIRNFSAQEGHIPQVRNVEDAPSALRHELLDLIFHLAEHNPADGMDRRVYHIICQHCGRMGSANPWGGLRRGASREIDNVVWPRIYDLIIRLWPEFVRSEQADEYRQGVNRILAGHGVAWDLGDDGRLHRVLPVAAQAQVSAAFTELSDARYAPALAHFNAARDAYDDRPRRDRDACANMFDAMEAVAKVKYNRPAETFGQIKNYLEQNNLFRPELIATFTALNQLRNRFFGHGAPFPLSAAEVDLIYLTCVGAILLFIRTA